MWNYEKRLQYPVHIKTPNAKIAKIILTHYGGPDGEMGASMRYLSQRFAMPNRIAMGTLNDIGTEELGHLEMVSTIVHQLTRNLSMEEIEKSGFADYYVDHTVGIWPQAAGGIPFNACEFQSKGDPITDLFEDMAAEQKARTTYDNILRLVDDPDVLDPIRFLRAREIVHFQRFGEVLRSVQENLDSKNFYAFNPSFDMPCKASCKDSAYRLFRLYAGRAFNDRDDVRSFRLLHDDVRRLLPLLHGGVRIPDHPGDGDDHRWYPGHN